MLNQDEVIEIANEFSCPMRLNLMVNDLSEKEIDLLLKKVRSKGYSCCLAGTISGPSILVESKHEKP